ncbi:uncharacterized protein HD556DRAFT_1423962 [Suillus plorans]|uniref:Uncharacterized protein n=1 Tax=Suillus plorans TaxID=116603 RepID=A0A9P7A9Z3_9AGAM|nr:uncharacterized protein HD556DRAFT_1423962 [Suillus plorans]KAG1785230.1 hypothetical protein HD556DRAFT_1423962 [Suillus plorans]
MQQGALSDLDEAIELYRVVLPFRSPGHPGRSTALNKLVISLHDRWRQRGSPSDLDEAIKLYAATLALCPPGHIPQLEYNNNLATSLRDRFQQHGTLSELEDVIELHGATLIFCPPHHALRSKQQGALSDLDAATEFYWAALALRPPGHSLIYVSTTLPPAFQPDSRNVPPYLTWTREAIKLHLAAVALRPPDNLRRFVFLYHLDINPETMPIGCIRSSQKLHSVSRHWGTPDEQIKHHFALLTVFVHIWA